MYLLSIGACLAVAHGVGTPANLKALAAVGAAVKIVEAHVALAAHGHAQRAVAEHFNAHRLARRAADVLFFYLPVYLGHLFELQLACHDGHVGKPGVEFERLGVADVELGGEVYLHALLAAVHYNGHVGRYYCRNARPAGGVDYLAHLRHVVVVDYGVDREVAFHPVLAAQGGNLAEVGRGEVVGRV